MFNAMTVDVEDYFQVSAFEQHVDKKDWDTIKCRVENNIDRILTLFNKHNVKATFFILGWIAERYPQMVKRIAEQGHEIASHGWEHIRVTNQTPEEFREDIVRTKAFLEELVGAEVKGYRAASYSINKDNLWAHDVLAEAGYIYSSSIVPIKHDLYGIPDAPRFGYRVANDLLLELPVTTLRLGDKNYPCGGGGWFRLFPYKLSRWAMKKVNEKDKQSGIFYFHPWEIDPEQPHLDNLSFKTRFRHYLNLNRMEKRLDHLLGDFEWGRMDEIFLK